MVINSRPTGWASSADTVTAVCKHPRLSLRRVRTARLHNPRPENPLACHCVRRPQCPPPAKFRRWRQTQSPTLLQPPACLACLSTRQLQCCLPRALDEITGVHLAPAMTSPTSNARGPVASSSCPSPLELAARVSANESKDGPDHVLDLDAPIPPARDQPFILRQSRGSPRDGLDRDTATAPASSPRRPELSHHLLAPARLATPPAAARPMGL